MSELVSDSILKSVTKPARYTGHEWNSIYKDLDKVNIRVAFCFPDVYEVGMSHLGIKILYHLLNAQEDIYCERVFSPWVDMEAKMRENKIPLFSLESQTPVNKFDFFAFTLQYEMSYTNIINALDLGNIPMMSIDRTKEHPFVIAGGPCAYNPEPLADFIDFFVMGEGEEVILEIMNEYREWKKSDDTREKFLEQVCQIEGVYVPQFYEVKYKEDNTIESFEPKRDNYPKKIKKRIVRDMDKVYYPEDFVVPYTEIVHDRNMLEIFRGCIRGCRFCQAGMVYRPVREKSSERLLELSKKISASTGYEETSLASLSTSDYTDLERLATELVAQNEEKKVNISLPSLRVDAMSLKLMEQASKVRKSGLTFAPEAGTQRLRDVINKGVTEEDLVTSTTMAFRNGYDNIKLYFMLGLPTESMEDVKGISELGEMVVKTFYSLPKTERPSRLSITLSTSYFVPKPFTPFQWETQNSALDFDQKQRALKDKIKSKNIKYNWHDSKLSFLEAVFALGDRRLSRVLLKAWEKGCRFDGWSEFFDYEKWISSFAECEIDPKFYANRKKSFEEILPWDFIDIGVSKKFLINECIKAYEGKTTPNCRTNCSGCGAASFKGGICGEKSSC